HGRLFLVSFEQHCAQKRIRRANDLYRNGQSNNAGRYRDLSRLRTAAEQTFSTVLLRLPFGIVSHFWKNCVTSLGKNPIVSRPFHTQISNRKSDRRTNG